jgi:hypothetical protein
MEMVKTHLFNMAKQAKELHGMLGDQDQVPEWVQEKLAVSCNMLDSVYDYLTPKMAKSAALPYKHLPIAIGVVAGSAAAAHRYAQAKPREGGLSRLQVEAQADLARHRAHLTNEGQDPDSGLKSKYLGFKNRVADASARETLLSAAAFGVPVGVAAAKGTAAALHDLQPYIKEGPKLIKGTPLEKFLGKAK